MKTYYYIPIKYEQELFLESQRYLETNDWSIITGVYKQGEYIEGNSIVFSKLIIGVSSVIPLSIKGYDISLKERLSKADGVFSTNDNITYIEYLNKL